MFIIRLHTGILESGILITKITEIGSSNIETIAELIDLNLSGESWAGQAKKEVVKIQKKKNFLLGLKYTLRTCFES